MLKVVAVGDIFLKTRNDEDPFKNTMDILGEKDILFGNLEVVLSKKGKKAEKFAALYTNPNQVRYLNGVNFDVLNIANNHILDRDEIGLKSTIETLKKNNLNYIGITEDSKDQDMLINKNGKVFGFLGYTIGNSNLNGKLHINNLKEDKILDDIKLLKNKCDFVVVSLHWGIENVFYPSPEQIKFAHLMVENGADLILGHHPHVIQGIEEYKNGLIAYSLGNFNFDYILSKSKTNKSIILNVNFNEEGILDYNVIPVEIDEKFIPNLIKGEKKVKELKFVSEISKPIIRNEISEKWWFEQIAMEYLSSNLDSFIVRIRKYGLKQVIDLLFWSISPFCIKCYLGIIRNLTKV